MDPSQFSRRSTKPPTSSSRTRHQYCGVGDRRNRRSSKGLKVVEGKRSIGVCRESNQNPCSVESNRSSRICIIGSGDSRNMNGFQKSTTRRWNPPRVLRIARPSVRSESDAKQGRKRKGSDRVSALVSFSRAPTLTQVSASRGQSTPKDSSLAEMQCSEQTVKIRE